MLHLAISVHPESSKFLSSTFQRTLYILIFRRIFCYPDILLMMSGHLFPVYLISSVYFPYHFHIYLSLPTGLNIKKEKNINLYFTVRSIVFQKFSLGCDLLAIFTAFHQAWKNCQECVYSSCFVLLQSLMAVR